MPMHLDGNRAAFCKAPFTLSVLNFKGLIHSKLPNHHSGIIAHRFPQPSLPSEYVRTPSSPHPDKQVLLPGSNGAPEQHNP